MDLMWKGSRKETIEDIVIYANRKFSGDIGDEDDAQQPESNDQWKKYFLKDLEEAQQVVCMKKVNGEAAHFSARWVFFFSSLVISFSLSSICPHLSLYLKIKTWCQTLEEAILEISAVPYHICYYQPLPK